MTPDEVRLLDNRYAILFIRGERPVLDLKYDILKHPNVALSADGGVAPYLHGESHDDIATCEVVKIHRNVVGDYADDIPETNFELLTEEELEEKMKKEMK